MRTFIHRAWRRVRWGFRQAWPERVVEREVQGVRMHLPWSHRLPDYARARPQYGQNLVHLAELLYDGLEPLTVLDIGANVGDSALQILHATDARVLCVEADRYFLEYLKRNVGNDPRVTVEEALLMVTADAVAMTPIRTGGTTRFVPGRNSQATAPRLRVDQLYARYEAFRRLRLVKSDTDGYDVDLIPEIARVWVDSHPVLFFEYDLRLSHQAGHDPLAVWPRLADLGYTQVAVWDNFGNPLGQSGVREAALALDDSRMVVNTDSGARPSYWDVAVVHNTDAPGLGAIDRLCPRPLR